MGRVCILCGAPLVKYQQRYCQSCALSRLKEQQRQAARKSKRKSRHPTWTEDDWQLHRQKKAEAKQAKAQAALLRQRRHEHDEERQQEWQLKSNRVRQRRHKGKVVCFWCEQEISPEAIQRRHRKDLPKFCNPACLKAWRQYFGFYRRFSSYGNEAQAEYKAAVGTIPLYEKRREAVIKANKENPKRKKKE